MASIFFQNNGRSHSGHLWYRSRSLVSEAADKCTTHGPELDRASFTCTATEEYHLAECAKALDGDLSTRWLAGGYGKWVGESMTVNFGATYNLGRMGFVQWAPEIVNQVKDVSLIFSDGSHQNITFAAASGETQWVYFDLVATQTTTVQIYGVSVHQQSSYNYGFKEIVFFESTA